MGSLRGAVQSYAPRSIGCGTRPCIVLCGHSMIPGRINAHGLTDEEMMLLDAMDLAAYRMPHSTLHQRYRGKEGKHHGCCGRRRWACPPGDVLSMVAERQA